MHRIESQACAIILDITRVVESIDPALLHRGIAVAEYPGNTAFDRVTRNGSSLGVQGARVLRRLNLAASRWVQAR